MRDIKQQNIKFKIVSLILLSFLISCSANERKPFELPNNVLELIAADSVKTWKIAKRYNNNVRMNMGDCFLSYRQMFYTNMTVHDNNGAYQDCGDTLKASWEIVTNKNGDSFIKLVSDQIPDLMNIKDNYKYFHILHVSQDSLVLQYKHKQFSSQEFIITDHLVTENTIVKDRNFHNK